MIYTSVIYIFCGMVQVSTAIDIPTDFHPDDMPKP